MSLQLEKRPVEFRGKQYELTFNNEALDALETEYGGMQAAMEDSVDHVSAAFLRILLNCARADLGEEPLDKRDVAREYSRAMIRELDIFGGFLRAMSPEAAYKAQREGETEKN